MDRTWVDAQKAKAKEKFEEERQRIRQAIIDFGKFEPEAEKMLLSSIDSLDYNDEDLHFELSSLNIDLTYGCTYVRMVDIMEYKPWFEKLELDKFTGCGSINYDRYLDSEPRFFDGDIIITDPCYIIREDNDWGKCGYGSNMEMLGIKNYITRDTLYGDWSCTTFNSDTKEVIGEFCADAGLVSVFDLAEVLAYNPDFDYHTERTWTTTLVKDFKGTVQFVVKHIEGVYENTTKWWNKGDKWEDYVVEVVGHGINKATGEPIDFIGTQTGL